MREMRLFLEHVQLSEGYPRLCEREENRRSGRAQDWHCDRRADRWLPSPPFCAPAPAADVGRIPPDS